MLGKLILAMQRWSALRSFPRGVPKASYVYFDYYVPLGGAHDRITIQDADGITLLSYEATSPLSDRTTDVTTELTLQNRADVFAWLRDRFPITKLLRIKMAKDPASLRLFAYDVENHWHCSLSVSGVQCCEDLRPFRGDFIEKIKRCLSATGSPGAMPTALRGHVGE